MENLKTALTWFDIVTVKDDDSKYKVIEQFVQDVIDFSSQYGSDISVSYSALNLSGKPSNFPDYGDFPQACVTVTTIFFLFIPFIINNLPYFLVMN